MIEYLVVWDLGVGLGGCVVVQFLIVVESWFGLFVGYDCVGFVVLVYFNVVCVEFVFFEGNCFVDCVVLGFCFVCVVVVCDKVLLYDFWIDFFVYVECFENWFEFIN